MFRHKNIILTSKKGQPISGRDKKIVKMIEKILKDKDYEEKKKTLTKVRTDDSGWSIY